MSSAATLNPAAPAASSTSSTANALSQIAGSNKEMGDRFLKLLVTQLKNQDPLNPMDNAQLTTQMAQINTVAGIEKLNDSVAAMSAKLGGLDMSAGLTRLEEVLKGLNSQMLQGQAVQGAALVGRQVWLDGDALALDGPRAYGAVNFEGPADQARVEILSAAGQVMGTVDLGAQATGRADFSWTVPEGVDASGWRFRVVALSGAALVKHRLQMADRVESVATGASGLTLELARTGVVGFDRIKSVS